VKCGKLIREFIKINLKGVSDFTGGFCSVATGLCVRFSKWTKDLCSIAVASYFRASKRTKLSAVSLWPRISEFPNGQNSLQYTVASYIKVSKWTAALCKISPWSLIM
jgi:hypothetical protein